VAFLQSHVRGVLDSTFLFRAAALGSLPRAMMIVMSAVYFGYFGRHALVLCRTLTRCGRTLPGLVDRRAISLPDRVRVSVTHVAGDGSGQAIPFAAPYDATGFEAGVRCRRTAA